MDSVTRQRVQGNLFPNAIRAIDDWETFPWHRDRAGDCDTWKRHSSQALAIDLFGTLKTTPEEHRNRILSRIAESVGVPGDGPWNVCLEWRDPANALRETRALTQIDAVAFGPRSVIFFECKFTEDEAGRCSQVRRLDTLSSEGRRQCNGNYERQINPQNAISERCALAGKNIAYWEIIPSVFRVERDRDHKPCPFRGSWFQMMRNLVLVRAVAERTSRRAAFVLAYADSVDLRIPQWLASSDWLRFLALVRPEQVVCRAISFQSVMAIGANAIQNAGEIEAQWSALGLWIEEKIRDAVRPKAGANQ